MVERPLQILVWVNGDRQDHEEIADNGEYTERNTDGGGGVGHVEWSGRLVDTRILAEKRHPMNLLRSAGWNSSCNSRPTRRFVVVVDDLLSDPVTDAFDTTNYNYMEKQRIF